MDMAHRENQEERTTEPVDKITEKQFLKELYLFMKKRDTPIERIPNLGFKQIDLFVMFQTVQDLGGYHQVTAQQLWKQVYNRLGGNPRSTSAATCTRRHYEKLLLPYECHVKGVMMNILPNHESKNFPFANFSKDNDDGQRPPKRKMLSIPLRQNPPNLQPDSQGRVFPLHLHYPHYYHPSHAILPPHVPISGPVLTPHSPPARQPPVFQPYCPNPTDRLKEPLEQLRYLAEQYKTSTGLTEPLNLSIKASRQETNSNPASSFTPTSLSKNPKFLNKASPLYTHCPQVVSNEGCETQDGEAGSGDTPYSYPGKAREAYVVDVSSTSTGSDSPTYDSTPTLRTDKGMTTMAQKSSSPKADFAIRPKEDREESPEVRGLTVSHVLPSLPRENGSKMEIEIPLSVLHNWLRLYGSSATMHDAQAKQLPPTLPALEENSRQRNCSDADILHTNLTFHMNPQHQSSAAEDLRLRKRNLPSPTLTTQNTINNHNTSQIPFTSYKAPPSSSIVKNAASRDIYMFDQQDFNKSYSTKTPNCWDAYDKETHALPIYPSSPIRVQQDFAVSKSYNEDTILDRKEKSEMAPSGVLMVDSSSASLLHLTTEEIVKLKKIISSS